MTHAAAHATTHDAGTSSPRCSGCRAELQPHFQFCPSCGAAKSPAIRARRIQISFRQVAAAAAIGGALWSAAYFTQSSLVGGRPTQQFHQANHPTQQAQDPAIEKLRAAVDSNPTDVNALRVLVGALVERARNENPPRQEHLLELIDALSQLLARDPKDAQALLIMAEVSFEQQLFDKAVVYYQRYLAIQTDDDDARARYASALTFLGKFTESEKTLREILARNPKSFPALAYLAVTAAQQGNKKSAREAGARAIAVAPSKEARDQIDAFLARLENKPLEAAQKSQKSSLSPATNGASAQIIEAIRTNPVAGPKFVDGEERDGVLTIRMRQFPMSAMPPFAREKFLGSIRSAAPAGTILEVRFVDADSGGALGSLSIPQAE